MGRVYAVVSAKGGVGKTTTAANVAAALAAGGSSVAVVDGDLGMANLASVLGVSPGDVTLHDVLADEADVEDAIRDGPHGMAVVPGSPDLDAFAGADPEGLRHVLDALREDYDYVLFDTGAGLSNDTVVPLTHVDEVLLVSTPTRDSLGDTKKSRQVAERLDVAVAGAALTRADPADVDADAVAESLEAEVLATIPDAEEVRGASEAGEPLTTFAPGSDAAAAFRSLAERLTGAAVETESAAVESTPAESAADATSTPEREASAEPTDDGGEAEPTESDTIAGSAESNAVEQPAEFEGAEAPEPGEEADDAGAGAVVGAEADETPESDDSGSDEAADGAAPEASGSDETDEDIVIAGAHEEDLPSDAMDEAQAGDADEGDAAAEETDEAADDSGEEPLVEPADPDEIAPAGASDPDASDSESGVYATSLTEAGEPTDGDVDLGAAESSASDVGDEDDFSNEDDPDESEAAVDDEAEPNADEAAADAADTDDPVESGDAGVDEVDLGADEDDADDDNDESDDRDGGKKGLFSRFFG